MLSAGTLICGQILDIRVVSSGIRRRSADNDERGKAVCFKDQVISLLRSSHVYQLIRITVHRVINLKALTLRSLIGVLCDLFKSHCHVFIRIELVAVCVDQCNIQRNNATGINCPIFFCFFRNCTDQCQGFYPFDGRYPELSPVRKDPWLCRNSYFHSLNHLGKRNNLPVFIQDHRLLCLFLCLFDSNSGDLRVLRMYRHTHR